MAPSLLARMSAAQRARSVVAACGSLAWSTGAAAGSTPFYEECGSPMLLATNEVADELLAAGTARLALDLHPRLGSVVLGGRTWALATHETLETLELVRRDHADCPGCMAWRFTRVIGFQVESAAIREPGDQEHRPIPLVDYELAVPDPMVAAGANIAAHLNTEHQVDLAAMATGLLHTSPDRVLAAEVGAINGSGFELSIIDTTGGRLLIVPLPNPATDPQELPDLLHDAIAAATSGRTDLS